MPNYPLTSLSISQSSRRNDLTGFLQAGLARKLPARLAQNPSEHWQPHSTPRLLESKIEEGSVSSLALSGTEKFAALGKAFVENHELFRRSNNKLAVQEVFISKCTLKIVAAASEQGDSPVNPSNALTIFTAKLGCSEDQDQERRYMNGIFELMSQEIIADISLFQESKPLTTELVSAPKTKRPSPSESLSKLNLPVADLKTAIVPANDDVKPAKRIKSALELASDIQRILEAGPSQRKPLAPSNVDKPKSKREPNLFITKEFNANRSPNYPALPQTSPYTVPVIEAIRAARVFAAQQQAIKAAKAAQPSGRNRY